MTYADLCLAGFAIGLGFFFAKEMVKFFIEWVDSFWSSFKKPAFIVVGLIFLLFFAVLNSTLSSKLLF